MKRRKVNKLGKGETASTSSAGFTSRSRTVTSIAEFSTTTRPRVGGLIAPLVRSTLPSSVHVITPSACAFRSPWWKHLRRRRDSWRSAPQMSQSLRSDTRPLKIYLRKQAGCLEPSAASPARELATRPSWSGSGVHGSCSSNSGHDLLSVALARQLYLFRRPLPTFAVASPARRTGRLSPPD